MSKTIGLVIGIEDSDTTPRYIGICPARGIYAVGHSKEETLEYVRTALRLAPALKPHRRILTDLRLWLGYWIVRTAIAWGDDGSWYYTLPAQD